MENTDDIITEPGPFAYCSECQSRKDVWFANESLFMRHINVRDQEIQVLSLSSRGQDLGALMR